ncbi:DUF5694 domain-containing protein [Echinicola vietnamensis]|uniref:Uncharacterized protein n=1 Tax=Echinicola vietnamensis (strain DSM 17526 / LMG 23754 / KMM 6221) TaxID=926556 RepID=L0G3J3_ECHVK|nr:DUF5694 domain-containing protein [Echinicola vietnamensis]AGA79888.1 hypothetical protein Echvi_3673 [Echinicola vietnamensis DSM 17526]
MKHCNLISKLTIISLLVVFFSCNDISNKKEKPTTEKKNLPKVAILGMLHFTSKNNTVNQKFTEVKSEKRQAEIKILIESLKKFNPTKIAVERPYRSEEALNEKYTSYLNGTYELTEEETDQIAFRLARELNHKRLFLAYSPVQYAFDSTVAFAERNGQSKLIDAIIENATELAKEYDKIASNGTIQDAVYYLNTDRAINKNHFGYILLSQIGNEKNKIGAETVGDWYKSNIKIFDNIRQLADSNTERILVIYGQGHLKILNQLIKDTPELELVKVNKYLK